MLNKIQIEETECELSTLPEGAGVVDSKTQKEARVLLQRAVDLGKETGWNAFGQAALCRLIETKAGA